MSALGNSLRRRFALQLKDRANTFIGNVGNVIPTKEVLSEMSTDLSPNDILNFKIQNNNISCFINKSYRFNNEEWFRGAPGITSGRNNMNYFIDLKGKVTLCRSFTFSNGNNRFIYLPNIENVQNSSFRTNSGKNLIVMPKLINLGTTLGNDTVFTLTEGIFYLNKFLKTANNGNPDGDIKPVTIYVDNYNTPPKPTILNTTEIGGTYAVLDFDSFPTHTNNYLGVMLFENGFFVGFYDGLILGLTPETTYTYTFMSVDEYFNISPFSKEIQITTLAIDTQALFQNAVAYWKFNETTPPSIDLINGYNGTDVGSGITRDGEWVDFGTNGSYIEVANNSDFSFIDANGNNTDFVIKTEIQINTLNTNGNWLISKRSSSTTGFAEWQLIIASNGLSFNIFNSSGSTISTVPASQRPSLQINTPYTIVLSKKGDTIRIALNGNVFYSEVLDSSFQMFAGTSPVQIGTTTFQNPMNLRFMGKMKETTILKAQGWDAGEISDNYNNGNGTTI